MGKILLQIDDKEQLSKDIKGLITAEIKKMSRKDADKIYNDELERVLSVKLKNLGEYNYSLINKIREIITNSARDLLTSHMFKTQMVRLKHEIKEEFTKDQKPDYEKLLNGHIESSLKRLNPKKVLQFEIREQIKRFSCSESSLSEEETIICPSKDCTHYDEKENANCYFLTTAKRCPGYFAKIS